MNFVVEFGLLTGARGSCTGDIPRILNAFGRVQVVLVVVFVVMSIIAVVARAVAGNCSG